MNIPIKTQVTKEFIAYFLEVIYGPSDREFNLAINKMVEKNSLLLGRRTASFIFNEAIYNDGSGHSRAQLHTTLRKDMHLLAEEKESIQKESLLIKSYLSVVFSYSMNIDYIFMHLPTSLGSHKESISKYITHLIGLSTDISFFKFSDKNLESKDYYMQIMNERLLFNLIKGIS